MMTKQKMRLMMREFFFERSESLIMFSYCIDIKIPASSSEIFVKKVFCGVFYILLFFNIKKMMLFLELVEFMIFLHFFPTVGFAYFLNLETEHRKK